MSSYVARRAPSAKVKASALRNITKAHVSRIRLKEPRSIGRVRPARKIRTSNMRMGRTR